MRHGCNSFYCVFTQYVALNITEVTSFCVSSTTSLCLFNILQGCNIDFCRRMVDYAGPYIKWLQQRFTDLHRSGVKALKPTAAASLDVRSEHVSFPFQLKGVSLGQTGPNWAVLWRSNKHTWPLRAMRCKVEASNLISSCRHVSSPALGRQQGQLPVSAYVCWMLASEQASLLEQDE